MTIPDTSIAKLSIDGDDNMWEGWWPDFDGQFTPEFESSVSVSAKAGMQIRVEFDVHVGAFGFDKQLAAGLFLDAPMAEIKAEAQLKENACDVEGADAGVDISASVYGEINAFAGAGKPEDVAEGLKFSIYSTSGWQITTDCITVTGSPATSAALTLSPSVPPWSNSSTRAN